MEYLCLEKVCDRESIKLCNRVAVDVLYLQMSSLINLFHIVKGLHTLWSLHIKLAVWQRAVKMHYPALRSEGKLPAWGELDFPLVWERVKLSAESQENVMQ